ncbi:hypothetical protein Q5X75_10710 [Acinetobacter baumannii]|nr:hypothetical protein [Acinetobacter baumannii]MDC5012940.1 hypothetical protein [Acinetobacter baumannii]MDC5585384.1 hypothetical protein [Acinetobacter baumannii]MDN8574998.1 hypothetical protein [Acinetobacter baumannii]MDO7507883.1 hypothetical protein [Acinetobacter baumannii]MDO7513650.1 hypothetical protein [Acinetobacter baumannii]
MLLSYQVKPDHREPKWNASEKSLWKVEEYIELDIFSYGINSKWTTSTGSKKIVWSYHRDSSLDNLIKIGEDHRRSPSIGIVNLGLAKFTCDHNNCWHGYPIDPATDSVPSSILKLWQSTLGKKLTAKINQGKLKL